MSPDRGPTGRCEMRKMCVEFRTADNSVKTGGLYNFTRSFPIS